MIVTIKLYLSGTKQSYWTPTVFNWVNFTNVTSNHLKKFARWFSHSSIGNNFYLVACLESFLCCINVSPAIWPKTREYYIQFAYIIVNYASWIPIFLTNHDPTRILLVLNGTWKISRHQYMKMRREPETSNNIESLCVFKF